MKKSIFMLLLFFLLIPIAFAAGNGEVLFTIGVHVEPFGETYQGFTGNNNNSYWNAVFFKRHCDDLKKLADLVEKYGGKLTIQVQSPFTEVLIESKDTLLSDLEKRGHEIALHFHEDAHLGPKSENLPISDWVKAMKEEIDLIKNAGVKNPVLYWSGGNLYPNLLVAAEQAGLKIYGDWKNPRSQTVEEELTGLHPWRPAGGFENGSAENLSQDNPEGTIIYLPQGITDAEAFGNKTNIVKQEGLEGWLDVIAKDLRDTVENADPDKINVFHFTVHPGEMVGDIKNPYYDLERFLREEVKPLTNSGKVRWATFAEKAKAYEEWEEEKPEISQVANNNLKGKITFVINVHDIANVNESADTIERFISIFEKYGVKGDFYFTAPIVQLYMEQRPDIIQLIKSSGMTVSYHFRPPHIAYTGFDRPLQKISEDRQIKMLRDFETFRLDLKTGKLDFSQSGGFTLLKEVFGKAPICASALNPLWKPIQLPIYLEMGAKMTLMYHEGGTLMENPYEWEQGLLIRPSDFGVTSWKDPQDPNSKDKFWWNMVCTRQSEIYRPTNYLKEQLESWQGIRDPFITVIIHENNTYADGQTWYPMFHDSKGNPLKPPYKTELNLTKFRPLEESEKIWQYYEELVKFASNNMEVITSEEIYEMAVKSE